MLNSFVCAVTRGTYSRYDVISLQAGYTRCRVANHAASMLAVYRPVYTAISFYLRVVMFISGVIVTAYARRCIHARWHDICLNFRRCQYYRGSQLGELKFAVFTGVFTFLCGGMLNIALSFAPKGLVLIIITVIDFVTGWLLFSSGVGTANVIGFYEAKGKVIACCAFSFIAMAAAATAFAFDLIELLVLSQHGSGPVSSQREHQMTMAALTSPIRSHSTAAHSYQPASVNSTTLEHTESTAKPVGTEPTVDGHIDTTAPGVPNEAQHEPKSVI